jgi:hypothetical protein
MACKSFFSFLACALHRAHTFLGKQIFTWHGLSVLNENAGDVINNSRAPIVRAR